MSDWQKTTAQHRGAGYRTVRTKAYGMWEATVQTELGEFTGTGFSEGDALYRARLRAGIAAGPHRR